MRQNSRPVWVDLDQMDTDNYDAGVGVHPKPPLGADDSYERSRRVVFLRGRSVKRCIRTVELISRISLGV